VLGLDGVPYTFLKGLMEEGRLPNMSGLFSQGDFRRMTSVFPVVSSVAWSTFMTGKNPGGHNIFGFIDREPDPMRLFIPTGRALRGKTLWERLGEMGKRVVVMNVPATYPPRPVKGCLVSGFLATDLRKAAYPSELAGELDKKGYVIDVDPWLARKSKDAFLERLNEALDRRFETVFYLMETMEWDYFHCHVMETDRINHFFWRDWEEGHSGYREAFLRFYEKIDGYVGRLLERFWDDTQLIVLSDHGFCGIKKEVQVNHWLEREGYLRYEADSPQDVTQMASASRAYSLIPGRIYINLKGREEKGCVEKKDYEKLREELIEGLMRLRNPETGGLIIKAVYRREEIYSGPYLNRAADLIAVPFDGFDLKGNVKVERLCYRGFIQGMHTYDDAFVYMSERGILKKRPGIEDLYEVIGRYFQEK